MKTKFYLLIIICLLGTLQFTKAQGLANRSLSNLNAATAVSSSLLPLTNNTLNLGSTALRWKNIYLQDLIFPNGTIQTTAFLPYLAGTGITISGTRITNAAPDKIVTLKAGNGIAITGSYPNFNIANTQPPSQWVTNGTSVYCTYGNIGIGTTNPTARLEVDGGDALINGVSIGTGHGAVNTNLAVGQQALNNNNTGFSNIVYGSQALYSNTAGYDNSALGDHALFSNIDGIENTSIGNGTLYYNVSGYGNTAVGNGALLNNGAVPNPIAGPEASYNSANGFFALYNNSTGAYNTAMGTATLNNNTTGSYNTSIGAYSEVAAENLTNATAVGANSLVNSSNKIRLGDVNVTVVESAAGSWTTSDGRFKNNIKEAVVGLSFIKLLRPVTYNFDTDKFDAFLSQHLPDSIKAKRKEALKKMKLKSSTSSIVQTGLIAQEVAAAAKKAGYNFSGVHVPEDNDDNYSLSYEKLVVPLVKSIQELSQQNEEMKQEIALLKAGLAAMQQNTAKQTINVTAVLLQQNAPNPFVGNTSIGYYLPATVQTAEILITDKLGNSIKKVALTATGKGTVEINSSTLPAGTYQYSLYINGNITDSKQMMVSK